MQNQLKAPEGGGIHFLIYGLFISGDWVQGIGGKPLCGAS